MNAPRHLRPSALARWLSPLALVASLFAVQPSGIAAPIAIRLGTILPSGTPQHTVLLELGERWAKETGGAVKLTVFGDARQGGEADMVTKIRTKNLNAGLFTVVGLSEIDRGVTGLQLMPLTFRTWAEVDYVREKMRPMLEERLRAQGFEVLCWADAGWVRFFSKAPAVTPADYRKAKVFVWAGDEPQIAIMKSIGFRPVALEPNELIMGLNTGMVNAAPMPSMLALAGQLYRPAPNMLAMNWCPIVGAVIMRKDVWESIPAAHRTLLRASAEKAGEKIRASGRQADDENVRIMQTHGLHVNQVPASAEADWSKFKDDLTPRLRGSTVPAEIFDTVEQHLRDFRQLSAATP